MGFPNLLRVKPFPSLNLPTQANTQQSSKPNPKPLLAREAPKDAPNAKRKKEGILI